MSVHLSCNVFQFRGFQFRVHCGNGFGVEAVRKSCGARFDTPVAFFLRGIGSNRRRAGSLE